MDEFYLIVPEAGTNYIRNPSFEYNVTDSWTFWKDTGDSAAVTQDFTQARFGFASAKMTAGTLNISMLRSDPDLSLADGDSMTVTAYVRAGASEARVAIYDTTNGAMRAAALSTSQTGWERLEATWTNDLGSSVNIEARLQNLQQDGTTSVYFDGVQLENATYSTTYIDGTRSGCVWVGQAHNSRSDRLATSRSGGREIALTTYNVHCKAVTGLGVPPLEHDLRQQALQDDIMVGNYSIKTRSIILTLYASGSSLANLHSIRKDLIDALKPDLVRHNQPVILRYDGAGTSTYISCLYESGLEMGQIRANYEQISLRLLALDAAWSVDTQEAAELTNLQTILNAPALWHRQQGEWKLVS